MREYFPSRGGMPSPPGFNLKDRCLGRKISIHLGPDRRQPVGPGLTLWPGTCHFQCWKPTWHCWNPERCLGRDGPLWCSPPDAQEGSTAVCWKNQCQRYHKTQRIGQRKLLSSEAALRLKNVFRRKRSLVTRVRIMHKWMKFRHVTRGKWPG